MGRTAAIILGAALAMAIFATPASAQVSVAVGVGAPRWGASVIVGQSRYDCLESSVELRS